MFRIRFKTPSGLRGILCFIKAIDVFHFIEYVSEIAGWETDPVTDDDD